METLTDKLRSSRVQLAEQGALFVNEARDAGLDFLAEAREASSGAAQRTRQASDQLVAALRTEAQGWRAHLQARRQLVADQVRQLTNARALERQVLDSVHRGLNGLDEQVEGRLKELGSGAAAAAGKGKPKALPIGDYEQLTAKDIVARLDALSADEVRALYNHERRHKQRRTVLRAAKQRLAS